MTTKLNAVSPTEKETFISSKRMKFQKDVQLVSKCPPSLDSLCLDLLKNHLLPCVGENQYRFVGAVNRTFRTAYTDVFTPTTTYD
jgi:hypothetical protein